MNSSEHASVTYGRNSGLSRISVINQEDSLDDDEDFRFWRANNRTPSWMWIPSSISRASPSPPQVESSPSSIGKPRILKGYRQSTFLLHLDSLMPTFFEYMAKPTCSNAARAISHLLDSSPPPEHLVMQNQKTYLKQNSGSSSPDSRRALPRRQNSLASPIFSRRKGTVEEKWKVFCDPFVLLAGLEALFADLEDLYFPDRIDMLPLYQRISKKLATMICANDEVQPPSRPDTPPLSTSPISSQISSHLTFVPTYYIQPANERRTEDKRYKELKVLLCWLEHKCKWIRLRQEVVESWSEVTYQNLKVFVQQPVHIPALLEPSSGITEELSTNLLCQSLQKEIAATFALLDMARCLEQGRFLETIVSAKRAKNCLEDAPSFTSMGTWMLKTFQDFLSIMPIVFDRTHSFAYPVYGFDQRLLLEETKTERLSSFARPGTVDLDELVLDFLKRQVKAGGSTTAVLLFLSGDDETTLMKPKARKDVETMTPAEGTEEYCKTALNMGFTLSSLTPSEDSLQNETVHDCHHAGIRSQGRWHPTYIRSSQRYSSSSKANASSFGLIEEMRRTTSPKLFDSQRTSTWSVAAEAVSPRSKLRQTNSPVQTHLPLNSVEYSGDSWESSWPHFEMDNLILEFEMASDNGVGPPFQTNNVLADKDTKHNRQEHGKKKSNLANQMESSHFETPGESSRLASVGGIECFSLPNSSTECYAALLSDCMWIAVMVKGEDEPKRNRRKNRGLSVDEVRSFLLEIAQALQVSSRFLAVKDLGVRKMVKSSLSQHVRYHSLELHEKLFITDDQIDKDVIQSLKAAFAINREGYTDGEFIFRGDGKGGSKQSTAWKFFDGLNTEDAAAYFFGPLLSQQLLSGNGSVGDPRKS